MKNRIFGILLSSVILAGTADAVEPLQPKVTKGQDVLTSDNLSHTQLQGFLGARMDANREGRLEKTLTEDMLLRGFRNRPGSHPWIGEHVGKWLHSASLAYEQNPTDQALKDKLDAIAKGLMDTQMEDGYLGTYSEEQRWSNQVKEGSWDVWVHKYSLYGLIHYYRVTGDEKALETCKKAADLLIKTFNEDDGMDILDAGTHAGMAATSVLEPMVLLYEYTDEPRYLEFCKYIIERADAGPKLLTAIEETKSVQNVGNKKAYEMMSNYVGLIEFWRATGDERALNAAKLAWESILKENRFVTGGIDAHEHFDEPGSLETTGHCTETCVQTSWVQMNWQLLRATGDAKYADELHRHIYNHMTAAMNPNGTEWCYFTTMEGQKEFGPDMHCCGSSGHRAIAMIPQFAYMLGTDGKSLAVNVYENSTFTTSIGDASVTVKQTTNFPREGLIDLEVTTTQPVEFSLNLLVPFFFKAGYITVGDKKDTLLQPSTYYTLNRKWEGTTPVQVNYQLLLQAHERDGRIAVSRGPVFMAYDSTLNPDLRADQIIPDLEQFYPTQIVLQGRYMITIPVMKVSEYVKKLEAKKKSVEKKDDEKKNGEPASDEQKNEEQPMIKANLIPYSEAGFDEGIISVYLPASSKIYEEGNNDDEN